MYYNFTGIIRRLKQGINVYFKQTNKNKITFLLVKCVCVNTVLMDTLKNVLENDVVFGRVEP